MPRDGPAEGSGVHSYGTLGGTLGCCPSEARPLSIAAIMQPANLIFRVDSRFTVKAMDACHALLAAHPVIHHNNLRDCSCSHPLHFPFLMLAVFLTSFYLLV